MGITRDYASIYFENHNKRNNDNNNQKAFLTAHRKEFLLRSQPSFIWPILQNLKFVRTCFRLLLLYHRSVQGYHENLTNNE